MEWTKLETDDPEDQVKHAPIRWKQLKIVELLEEEKK